MQIGKKVKRVKNPKHLEPEVVPVIIPKKKEDENEKAIPIQVPVSVPVRQ